MCQPLFLATTAGLEPATPGLGNLCSIRLSYVALCYQYNTDPSVVNL